MKDGPKQQQLFNEEKIKEQEMGNLRINTLRTVLLVSSLLLFASAANADPIVLTSGSFSVSGQGGGFNGVLITDASGTGPDLSFQGHNINDLCGACSASPGGTVSTLNFQLLGGGVVTYQGVQYPNFTLSFGFTDNMVTGSIHVFETAENANNNTLLFTLDFVGSGVSSEFFDPNLTHTFHFTATPQSVPEPAAMLLLGSGVAAAGLRRFRSQNRSSPYDAFLGRRKPSVFP